MAYTYSKTDWVADDIFELEDWIRIRNNYNYVWSVLQSMLHESPELEPAVTQFTSNLDKPYYDDVNTLESHLQYMYTHESIPFPEWSPSKTWTYRTSATYPEVGNPTFEDWNRWETFIERMYETVEYWGARAVQNVSGTSYSGKNRRVQTLSRGR